MCIAILNTKGTISKKTFKTCWINNPDGGGLAYSDKGKVKTVKELKCFKQLYKSYLDIRQAQPDANILIHFRIATHGKINETNCHPFKVNSNLAFIHNGMIYGKGLEISSEFSDTYLFNQVILKKLPQNFIKNEAILKLLEEYIEYSKIIFITGGNDWAILNENLGFWDGDNWYSNKSYKPQPKLIYSQPLANQHKKNYFNYADREFWKDNNIKDWLSESETYNPKENYCECCNESSTNTKYVSEYNIEMCQKCIDQYVYPLNPKNQVYD
jgi:predicted glutamine amidotransferase